MVRVCKVAPAPLPVSLCEQIHQPLSGVEADHRPISQLLLLNGVEQGNSRGSAACVAERAAGVFGGLLGVADAFEVVDAGIASGAKVHDTATDLVDQAQESHEEK